MGSLEARRDFVNKLWNVGRFVRANTTAEERAWALDAARAGEGASLPDRWIASRLDRVIADVTRGLADFNFGEAGRVIHDFVWDALADWYLEALKVQAREGRADGILLARVFEKVLRLLHPFAPFVTEELWQRLLQDHADRPTAVMVADWPAATGNTDTAAEEAWQDLMAVVKAARVLRTEYHIEPAQAIGATIVARGGEAAAFWRDQAGLISSLPGTRLRPLDVVDDAGAAAELATRSLAAVAGGVELLIPAEGLFDVQAEVKRAEAETADAQKQVARLEGLLGRPGFAEKAPPEVVQAERERLAEQRERLAALERRRATLARLGG